MYASSGIAHRVSIMLCIAASFAYGADDGGPMLKEGLTVIVTYSKGSMKYSINSRPIAPADCLRVLGDEVRKREKPVHISVFADQRTSFEGLENLRGLISKSGAENVRLFIFAPDHSLMEEVHFDRAIPYSLTVK